MACCHRCGCSVVEKFWPTDLTFPSSCVDIAGRSFTRIVKQSPECPDSRRTNKKVTSQQHLSRYISYTLALCLVHRIPTSKASMLVHPTVFTNELGSTPSCSSKRREHQDCTKWNQACNLMHTASLLTTTSLSMAARNRSSGLAKCFDASPGRVVDKISA